MITLPRALFDADEAPSLLYSSRIPEAKLKTLSQTIDSLINPWILLAEGISSESGESVSFYGFTSRMSQYLVQLSPTQDVFMERVTTGKKIKMITFTDYDSTESVQSPAKLILPSLNAPKNISLDVDASRGVFQATPKLEVREICFEVKSLRIWQMNVTDDGKLDYDPEYHGVSEVVRFDRRKPAVY